MYPTSILKAFHFCIAYDNDPTNHPKQVFLPLFAYWFDLDAFPLESSPNFQLHNLQYPELATHLPPPSIPVF